MAQKSRTKKERAKLQRSGSKPTQTSAAALKEAASEGGAATERMVHEAAEAGQRNFETTARATDRLLHQGRRSAEAWRTATEQGRESADQVAGISADASARLTHGVEAAAAVVAEVAQETMKRDVATVHSMLRCQTFADLLRVQSDWVRGTLDILLSRSAQLSQIATGVTLGTLQSFEGAAAASRR